jgi:hypothetical protein
MNRTQYGPLLLLLASTLACDDVADTGGDAGTNPPTEEECPGPLKEAAQTCSDPACSETAGIKIFGQSELASTVATEWVIPVFAANELAASGELTTLRYLVETAGGLTPRREAARANVSLRARALYGDETFASVFSTERAARIRADVARRAAAANTRFDASSKGTGIRPAIVLPDNVHKQDATCSAASPVCDATSLCIIPPASTDGTCESALMVKFKGADVAATVKKVGEIGVVVAADSVTVSDADVTEILNRFDTHIAPLDHQFFGMPSDRDQNGKVIIFLADITDAGVVGYFASDDLMAPGPNSNGAEILYMRAPGASITLDQISGTIAHEYQHLINFVAKAAAGSGSEDLWLDEGLAAFAEDVSGYGADAFENIAAYLMAVDQTSLTGDGGCPDGNSSDSSCRRGMAHLLVRYYFEQKGAATFAGAGAATDKGGIAAVRALVAGDTTGTFSFTQAATGRSFDKWLGDLITTVAADGAGYAEISCNPMYKLDPPLTSSFTNYQIGIDLRSSFRAGNGQTRNLMGPIMADLVMEDPPLYANAGEVRKISVATGTVKIGVGGSVDYVIGYHALPANQ